MICEQGLCQFLNKHIIIQYKIFKNTLLFTYSYHPDGLCSPHTASAEMFSDEELFSEQSVPRNNRV